MKRHMAGMWLSFWGAASRHTPRKRHSRWLRRVREPGDVADYSARVTQRGPDQPCCCVGRFPEVGTEPAREIVTFESSCSHRDATTGCHLHRASTASLGGEQPLPALPFDLTCG